ncbi:hypothetical protein Rpal_2295 [Rhodopseudomonas palustris TIE-1]|nr:hypothetical protein Rpal_2295 [Rhodopseudomonas palustris TIE-1]
MPGRLCRTDGTQGPSSRHIVVPIPCDECRCATYRDGCIRYDIRSARSGTNAVMSITTKKQTLTGRLRGSIAIFLLVSQIGLGFLHLANSDHLSDVATSRSIVAMVLPLDSLSVHPSEAGVPTTTLKSILANTPRPDGDGLSLADPHCHECFSANIVVLSSMSTLGPRLAAPDVSRQRQMPDNFVALDTPPPKA